MFAAFGRTFVSLSCRKKNRRSSIWKRICSGSFGRMLYHFKYKINNKKLTLWQIQILSKTTLISITRRHVKFWNCNLFTKRTRFNRLNPSSDAQSAKFVFTNYRNVTPFHHMQKKRNVRKYVWCSEKRYYVADKYYLPRPIWSVSTSTSRQIGQVSTFSSMFSLVTELLSLLAVELEIVFEAVEVDTLLSFLT